MKKEIKSALVQDENNQNELNSGQSLESSMYGESLQNDNSQSVTSIGSGAAASVSSFSESCKSCQRNQNTAQNGLSSSPSPEDGADGSGYIVIFHLQWQ